MCSKGTNYSDWHNCLPNIELVMDKQHLETLLTPYNPWWHSGTVWDGALPEYQRPVVDEVLADLRDLPQIISVTGRGGLVRARPPNTSLPV